VGADRLVHAADPRAAAAAGQDLNIDRTLAGIVVAGAALALVPLAGLPAFYESFLYLVFHWMILATSWNILSGYSGYFSFGHGAFFGAGTYATATLASRYDVPFLWTLPVAGIVAALLGVALGAVAFRVRHVRAELFALLTLAVTFVVATIIANTPIDGGPGVYLSAVPVPSLAPTPTGSFYLMALAVAVATIALAYAITRSAFGLALNAIHDDEDAAEGVGVPTYRVKLAAFALSCALAGIAGGIQALFVSYVTVGSTFSITVPLTVVLMSVLGGTRHWGGPAAGALVVTTLLYAFTAGDHAIAGKAVFGAILIAVILFMPDGMLGRRRSRDADARTPSRGEAVVRVSSRGEAEGSAVPAQWQIPRSARNDNPADDSAGEPMLEVRALSKSFAGVRALAGVDLDVHRGEIVGLLGPNGSGKSTLINVVSGHLRPDRGSIRFEGQDIAGLAGHRIARAGIARTFQIPRPFAHLAVIDNVALAATFGCAALARAEALAEARRWLAFSGLANKASALPDELNLHQRKFLELARALASRPRLVLLDEVLSGLTPGEIGGAIDLIRAIRDHGATIVFVEHVMRAVLALADRLVVLDHGIVIAEGGAPTVLANPDVITAFLGATHA
jgi:ABC-type branched-subunit amino acid transport system ATPase component/ABC-type branched-subunit amino acid transport system permease subunit